MSGNNVSSDDMKEVLKDFAGILAVHSQKTDTALEKLTGSVEELTKAHIETKKDREYDSARMERMEENQKTQGKKLESVSDTVLLLDERVGTQGNKWAELWKIITTIGIAVGLATFLPIL